MSEFSDRLDAAAGAATCQFLQSFGSSLVGYGAYTLFAGGTGTVPLALGSAALLASNYGCTWDTEGTPSAPSPGPVGNLCWETDGSFNLERYFNGTYAGDWATNIRKIISSSYRETTYGVDIYDFQYVDATDGLEKSSYYESGGGNTLGQKFNSGSCLIEGPGTAPTPAPYTYVDQTSGCEINVQWEGVVLQDDGTARPVYSMEQATAGLRTGGGIIGGCNFAPVLYVGGGGGGGEPPFTIPTPIDPPPGPGGQPWWLPLVEAALGGVVGAAVKALLDEVLQQQVGGKVYRITSVCETDSQGEPISQSVEVDIPNLPWDEAVIYRLDAIEHIMQGLKDFKQPICRPQKPVGDLVTVNFQSDEPSIAGEKRLRKTLNYRDQMASDLAAHAAHWENFVWQAGPAIVSHEGAAWGRVTVWALDADEGKRVIRHAATISGVNPDAEGEWVVAATSNPRYGRTGTMRLGTYSSSKGTVLRISKRGTPDGLPIVPVDPAA